MTTTSLPTRPVRISGPEDPIAKAVTALMGLFGNHRRLRQSRRFARDVKNLQAMSDHMLRDIGLNRADIFYAVHNGSLPDR